MLAQLTDIETGLEREPDFFRALVENSEDLIVVLDPEARLVYVSPSVGRMLGYTIVGENLGLPLWEFVHPEDLAPALAAFQRVLSERRTRQPVELRVRHRDGSWRELEARASVMADAGAGPRLVVNGHDVSERKQAERQLRWATDVVEAFLKSSPLGVILVDPEDRVQAWNPAAERIFGWPADEVLGKVYPAADEAEQREHLALRERALRGELLLGLELRRRRRDGSAVTVRVWRHAVKDARGGIVGTIVIVEDVTETRRMEEALFQGQKLESLGVLAGGVAHDFNNILGAIMGHASLALGKLPPESPARRNLTAVLDASERAASLSRKMLAFSGRGQFELRRFDARGFLAENRGLLEAGVPKEIRFDLQQGGEALPLEADAGQLSQALVSLVLNAVEAIGPHRGTIGVATRKRTLTAEDAESFSVTGERLAPGHYASLVVEDDGCGIEPTILGRIFEPFFTTKFTGRGLGLSAVLGIVRGHRGGLAVTSAPGKGTRFELLFPLAEATAAPAAIGPQPTGRGVLVVDDEPALRDVLLEALNAEGIPAWGASDGAQALQLIDQFEEAVAVVMLDLSMPGMNGQETLQALRRRGAAVKVILTSGYPEADLAQRLEGARPDAFLQKPYRAPALLQLLRRLLGPRGTAL